MIGPAEALGQAGCRLRPRVEHGQPRQPHTMFCLARQEIPAKANGVLLPVTPAIAGYICGCQAKLESRKRVHLSMDLSRT